MFVVGHTVTEVDDAPEISFDIVGTTGNIYKTTIGKVSSCSCPDALKGNQCKHICYGTSSPLRRQLPRTLVSLLGNSAMSELLILLACEVLVKALRAPQHLQYQLAFLSSVS